MAIYRSDQAQLTFAAEAARRVAGGGLRLFRGSRACRDDTCVCTVRSAMGPSRRWGRRRWPRGAVSFCPLRVRHFQPPTHTLSLSP